MPITDIDALKRERPDLFDEQDVPDITDVDRAYVEELRRRAPARRRAKPTVFRNEDL